PFREPREERLRGGQCCDGHSVLAASEGPTGDRQCSGHSARTLLPPRARDLCLKPRAISAPAWISDVCDQRGMAGPEGSLGERTSFNRCSERGAWRSTLPG